MRYKIVLSVDDRALFIREMFMVRNKTFQNKVKISTDKDDLRIVIVESDDYLCVEDVLICDLDYSIEAAKNKIALTESQ